MTGDDDEARDAATPRIDTTELLGDVTSQVQDAVLSLVAVGRVALDMIERLARDPGPLVEAARGMAATGRAAAGASPPPTGADAPPPGPSRRPRVEHVRVEPPDA